MLQRSRAIFQDYISLGQQTKQLSVLINYIKAYNREYSVSSNDVGSLFSEHPAEKTADEKQPSEHRLLQVGVVGVPNAGKSTLTNSLVGSKVSAVSAKTNTTANTRLGAYTVGSTQVVLFDTPGVVDPRHVAKRGYEQRVRSAWTTAINCDMLLFIIDAHRQLLKPDPRVTQLVSDYGSGNPPAGFKGDWDPPPSILVLNKVDAIHKEDRPALLRLADGFRNLNQFSDIFWISALKGHGLADLREYLVSQATPGEWTVDADSVTDMNDDDIASELIREKIFQRFYEELPYEIKIVPESIKTLRDGSIRIEKTIRVPSESARKIVVGKKGAAVGAIGRAVRLELSDIMKVPVHLIINVKTVS